MYSGRQFASSPSAFPLSAGRTLSVKPSLVYGAYDIHSRALTVFDEARSLRLCLSSFGVRAGYATPLFFFWLLAFKKKIQAYTHPGFLLQTVTSFHWPGLAHYYGTIRHLAALWLGFPFRLYRPYLVRVCVKETTRLPSVICTFCSIHPDPNHVDESCRSFPFVCFPVRYTISYRFPRFYGGSPSIAATSGSLHSGLDFACRPFGFFLTEDTLPIQQPSVAGCLLRLRHFKG